MGKIASKPRRRTAFVSNNIAQGSKNITQGCKTVLVVFGLCLSHIGSAADSNTSDVLSGLVEKVSVDVKAFQLQGDNPLPEKLTNALLEPYLGTNKGIDTIEQAAAALENEMRVRGHSFYRVTLPPQELTDGVVDLVIKRYKIGRILVRGNKFYTDNNIIASVPPLKLGSSPSTSAIAKSLALANQNSGKRTRLTLAPGSDEDQIDATLTVVDQKPLMFNAWLNNSGTEASGDFRVGASATHRNLFGLDHAASLTFITSPEGIDDVQQFAGSYRIPVYQAGGTVNLFAVQSDIDTGTVADVFDVAGSGTVLGAGYSQALAKIGDYRHQWSVQVSDKLFDNDVTFQNTQLIGDVRSRPLQLSYQSGWNNSKGLSLGGSISAITNLSGGTFNDEASYQASRVGAEDDWSKFELSASAQYANKKWLYSAALNYTTSSDRLITGEQFAIGGNNSIRGAEERELRGDEGYRIGLQLWAPPITKGIRPIAFIDHGRIENNGALDGELSSESITSIGVMSHWNPTNKISASLSYGYLLDGIDNDDPLSDVSRDGDSKLNFNINYRF